MRWRCIYALLLAAIPEGLLQGQNPVQIENSLSGTSGWQLSNPAVNREIEGYASLTSVNIGGTIAFSVSTTDSTFNIDIFRTGWYSGVGARLQTTISNLPGALQTTPAQNPVTKLIECKWPASYTLTVPTTWVSGIYLARLTGKPDGKQSWIIFVVRDDNRDSALLFENSVTTYQAYNFWPNGANGRSLYGWGNTSDGLPAWKVSFDRPYVLGRSYSAATPGASSGVGAGEYLTNLQPGAAQNYPIFNAGFDYNMVRWLEKNGYDVTYLTDIDVHENAALLKNHRALLSPGHNEYWSTPMVQNVQNALANGLNLGFFSADSSYWQVRFEPASDGTADRTMVCYKYDAPANDPLYNSNPPLSTVRWRDPHLHLPEAAWIGAEYVGDPFEGDIVVSNASHWLMSGTELHNGDHLTGLLGYEVDAIVPGTSPANIQALTSSPVGPFGKDSDNPPGLLCSTQACNSSSTWYSAGQGFVFNAGSMNWSWGLDDYNSPSLRPAFSSAAAQTLTTNILAAFINPVSVVTTSLPAGAGGNSYTPFQLTAAGGGQPYTWSASGLPPGMTLSSSGMLGGIPTSSGSSNVAFTATDAASHSGSVTRSLVINSGPCAISGRVMASGTGLSGVSVSLTGASTSTATTDSSGSYSFAGLMAGAYTVTAARSGYAFTPPAQTFSNVSSSQTASFTATAATGGPRVVSIQFVGSGAAMGASESAGVVAKTNWNNATNNVSGAPLALNDETGVSSGAVATWTSDNNWALPITDTAGNTRMMRGYLDTGRQNPSSINIAGLPVSSTGYDVYVYTDGDNAASSKTGAYTISGAGIASASVTATDAPNVNFSGAFTQAINSAGNYVKFSSIQATAFTITATPAMASDGYLRAPVNGIQIVPSPAPAPARTVSIKFVGSGAAMGGSESAGVVAKTNWNNAVNNVSSGPLALNDEIGFSNGAVAAWTSDNNWALPITDAAGNARMMRGYLDTGRQNPSAIYVAGLPFSTTGYDVYVYTDGDNAASSKSGTYTISGPGINSMSVKATDAPNVNFSGAFTQALGSSGNYIKFSSIQATTFTITAAPTVASDGYLRAPVNGIQIVPSPAPMTARTVSIKFVGSGAAMGGSESAGVVAKTNWNNAVNNVSGAPLALNDETGVSNGAVATWTSDNNWALPITDAAGNARMMRGYLDTGNRNPSTVNISGLPFSPTGYDVYVYTDGDNAVSSKTGTYTISGAGITSTSVIASDAGNVNFSGTFTQAINSNGNYVKFSSIQAAAFTITATPATASDGYLRAPVNSIQIVPH